MINNIETLANRITKAVIQEATELNEISRNKKNQIKRDAINAISGDEDNVKTFLIITAENPMGEKASNNLNRNNNHSMVKYLKSGNYAWQPVRGKYGNTENSKIIFNISLSEAESLALKFTQETFIYGKKDGEKTTFELYKINNAHTGYNFVEKKDYYEDMKEGDDFYTAIDKALKFSVPFDYFKEACDRFNNIINEAKEKNTKYRENYDSHLKACLNENKTGYSLYINRSLIYGGLFRNYPL